MGKKIYKLCVIILVLIMVMLCACEKKKDKKEEETKETNKDIIKIGMSFDSFVVERWRKDADVFTSKIKDYYGDAEVNIQNANGNASDQVAQIEYLIESKVDVLVIVCINSESLSGVIEKAKKAGIPIIAYDRLISNANVDLYISFDNYKVGEEMAEALYKAGLPGKKVLMLPGPDEDNNVAMVCEGFKKVMEEKGVRIVDSYSVENWDSLKAKAYIEHLYNDTEVLDSIDGIMCGNDAIATSVIRTLSELRMTNKNIKVVGQDADIEACQRIVEGTQLMTVYKPVETLASTAADYAIDLARNHKLDDVGGTIYDGKDEVPYKCLDIIAVDKDNMDETVIKSGFHLYDDVYYNVNKKKKTTEETTKNGN